MVRVLKISFWSLMGIVLALSAVVYLFSRELDRTSGGGPTSTVESEEAAEYKKNCEANYMAYEMAEQFVKRSLKAPSTADFPWFRSDMVSYRGDCTHVVRSYVDAQNGFGAMLRSHWRAEVQYVDGRWRLLDIQIN